MSEFDDDCDDWDDLTPSFQDKLIENLESVENIAFAPNSKPDDDFLDNVNFTSSKAAFEVFLDELFQIPYQLKKKSIETKPLSEIPVNQQRNRAPLEEKNQNAKQEKNVEEDFPFIDSQEDSFWTKLDTDILSELESSAQKEKIFMTKVASGKPFSTPTAVSEKTLKTSLAKEKNVPKLSGFTTALTKLRELDKETVCLPESSTAAPPNLDTEKQIPNKRPFDSTEDKFVNVLNEFGGFQMAHTKKKYTVSSEKTKQFISLLEADSTAQPLRDIGNLKKMTDSPIIPDKDTPSSTNIPKQNIRVSTIGRTTKPFKSPVNTNSKPLVNDTRPSTNIPKQNVRMSTIGRSTKPFKSPVVLSNIELTRAAVHNKNINKPKVEPVFDLTIPKNRLQLSSLGKPLQFSEKQLLAKNIPPSIINMTIKSAKRYLFDGTWGYRDAQKELIENGALSTRAPLHWVENHYGLIVWKFACLIRSYPSEYLTYWSSKKVLDQLLYRYEREINMGQRPILRKVMEQDDISVKHMVLVISEIIKINTPLSFNTSSKYQLMLTDGWYQVPACIDLRMERAIDKKKLKVGYKLSICGAQIVGDKTPQSPLTISNNKTLLSISTNGCLPAKWDAKLGYQKQKLIMRSISTVFDDGGPITALDIIVCRKFPILYTESLPGGNSVTRTAKEEEEARRTPDLFDHLTRQQSAIPLPNFKADQKSSNHVHLDRSNSEPKKFDERIVKGFFRIRICDAKSNADQSLATLLISNANELNHMDIIEGKRYKVFFTVPYRQKNKKHAGLDLKTTRMTRWEPTCSNNLKNAYIPRYLTPCKDICRQDDFDLAVLVLKAGTATLDVSHGRKLYHQKLFVSDDSGQICQIDFRVPMNPFSDVKGQVVGLRNVRFEFHDNKFNITCLKATDETEVVTKLSSVSEYMQKGVTNLRKWVSANPKRVKELSDHIQSIVQ